MTMNDKHFFTGALRPTTLADFIGHEGIKAQLAICLEAARRQKTALGHLLFYGPPGIGKTTLALIMAKEMATTFYHTSGPALRRLTDIDSCLKLCAPEKGDVFFVDEIHALSRAAQEVLYPVMEQGKLITAIKGTSVNIALQPFSVIGCSTRIGKLSEPLLARFKLVLRLDYYEPGDMFSIAQRSAKLLKLDVTNEALQEVAKRARGTPREANRILWFAKQYQIAKRSGRIDLSLCREILRQLSIDQLGLQEIDRRLLQTLMQLDRAVGLNHLAAALSEDKSTIQDAIEPFLLRQGLLARTARGRVITPKGIQHLSKATP